MLVLHVQETPPGGVVNFLRELTAAQVKRGHEVHLLTPKPKLSWPGVTQHEWSLSRGHPISYPGAIAQYLRAARKLAPDVIHLHSFWAGQFGRPPLLSRLVKAPVVYQPHAWNVDRYNDPLFRRLVWAMERRAGRSTNVMVANCWDEIAEGHRAGVPTPGHWLGVPLDTERFNVAGPDARNEYRESLGIKASRVVLCLGRLVRQKGQDQLVKAWEKNPIPDTELILVGPGDAAQFAELAPTQWEKSLRIFPAQADVRPWIWASDVVVQPSRYDTVGLSIAEAMSCGRPVVATRANGVAEAVGEDPASSGGAVVPLGAMDLLLEECARRLDDPNLWNQEAQQARKRAVDRFSADNVADRLDGAYLEARRTTAASMARPRTLQRGGNR